MNADHFTTLGADPFLFFIANEMSDPKFIDHFEIVDHAHSIVCSVSLVQMLQPIAGKTITTTEAIRSLSLRDLFAVLDLAGSTVL